MKFHAILSYITKLFLISKKSYMFVSLSLGSMFTLFLDKINHKFNDDNLTELSIFFVVLGLAYLMTFIDTFVGIIASISKNQGFSSDKFGNFIAKLLALLIYTLIGSVVFVLLSNSYFLRVIIYGILFLVLLNEFVSIGENLEKWLGRKPYMFTLIDKLFSVLELKFMNIIKNKLKFVKEEETPFNDDLENEFLEDNN